MVKLLGLLMVDWKNKKEGKINERSLLGCVLSIEVTFEWPLLSTGLPTYPWKRDTWMDIIMAAWRTSRIQTRV